MALHKSPLASGSQCSREWEVILFNLGQTYKRLGVYDQALSCYKRALKINPDTPSTLSSIAHVYLLQEEYQEVTILCERILELNSNDQFTCLMLNYAIEELQHQSLPFGGPPSPAGTQVVDATGTVNTSNTSEDISLDLLEHT